MISGAAGIGLSVNNTGGGILTLSGANTYSGGTILTPLATSWRPAAARSYAGGYMTSGPFGTGPLTLDGGTLQASGSRTVSNAVAADRPVPLWAAAPPITSPSPAI